MTQEELTTLIYEELAKQGYYVGRMVEQSDVSSLGEYGESRLDGLFNLAQLARVILERLAQE